MWLCHSSGNLSHLKGFLFDLIRFLRKELFKLSVCLCYQNSESKVGKKVELSAHQQSSRPSFLDCRLLPLDIFCVWTTEISLASSPSAGNDLALPIASHVRWDPCLDSGSLTASPLSPDPWTQRCCCARGRESRVSQHSCSFTSRWPAPSPCCLPRAFSSWVLLLPCGFRGFITFKHGRCW